MTSLQEAADTYNNQDPQMIIIHACLVMCLRRLRESHNNHLLSYRSISSLVERQQAEDEAAKDATLIEMIEGILLANPLPEPP